MRYRCRNGCGGASYFYALAPAGTEVVLDARGGFLRYEEPGVEFERFRGPVRCYECGGEADEEPGGDEEEA